MAELREEKDCGMMKKVILLLLSLCLLLGVLSACADANFYNQLEDAGEHPHDTSEDEHIIEYTPEYNYAFFLDYNKENTVGLGNSIFFHCTGANTYTGGCIAVSEEDMLTILSVIDQNARVMIDYMP